MNIRPLPPDEAHRLWPLLHRVRALHVRHYPERYPPFPADPETLEQLTGRLQGRNMQLPRRRSKRRVLRPYASFNTASALLMADAGLNPW